MGRHIVHPSAAWTSEILTVSYGPDANRMEPIRVARMLTRIELA